MFKKFLLYFVVFVAVSIVLNMIIGSLDMQMLMATLGGGLIFAIILAYVNRKNAKQ